MAPRRRKPSLESRQPLPAATVRPQNPTRTGKKRPLPLHKSRLLLVVCGCRRRRPLARPLRVLAPPRDRVVALCRDNIPLKLHAFDGATRRCETGEGE